MEEQHSAPLASVIDLILDAVFAVGADGRIVFVSAACERIFGYTPEELVGRSMIDMVVAEDVGRTLAAAQEVMSGQSKLNFENRYRHKDGREVHVMWSARWSAADQLRIGVARDITELKQVQGLQSALYSIAEAAHAATDLFGLCQHIQQIIARWQPVPGFCLALYDGPNQQLSFPYHAETDEPNPCSQRSLTRICEAVISTGQPLLLTPQVLRGILGEEPVSIAGHALCWVGTPLYASQGCIGVLLLKVHRADANHTEKLLELLLFISRQLVTTIERQRLHARLQHMAQNDELTGLPNRTFLYDRLNVALARVKRSAGGLCIIFLDLNKFKQVNDSFGHAVGDLLLQEVAARLRHLMRDEDSVARIGGDEFVVLLESIQQAQAAVQVAEKIRTALSQPMNIAGHNLCVLPSIGIAHYPEHGDGAAQLLKYADEAMYQDKNNPQQSLLPDQ
jgi:diguanylate cyclase (GGDEF)-like protein/PAS domain S-box-containing protein